MKIRKSEKQDLEQCIKVEAAATPGLHYIANVFDLFHSDRTGEFCVAHTEDRIVGLGKFTLLPDNSAWIETLRVLPEYQGMGIGKMFYRHFIDLGIKRKIKKMRMYTGTKNVVSRSLAEKFGFEKKAEYKEAWTACGQWAGKAVPSDFKRISDPEQTRRLLAQMQEKWSGFLVMNRTFYAINADLSMHLTASGMVYEDVNTGSMVIAGYRFMPEKALHIALLKGDPKACLDFAMAKGMELKTRQLNCLFPPSAFDIEGSLTEYGFQTSPSALIVMEASV